MGSDKEETEAKPEVVTDSSVENIPQKAASESEVLKGVVVLVDVRCGREDWSDSIEVQLVRLGARTVETFVSDLTHVVFKDGHRRTLNAALRRKVHLVNVLWIDSCRTKMYRDNEENFKVIIPEKPIDKPWYVKRVEQKHKYLLDQKPDPWEELNGVKSTPPVSRTPAPKKATIDSYFASNSAGSASASKTATVTPLGGRNTRRRSKLLLNNNNVNQPETENVEKTADEDSGDYIDHLFSRIDTPNGPSAVEAITESLSVLKRRYNHLDSFRNRQNSPMSSACSSVYDDEDAPYIPLMERCRAKQLVAANGGGSTPTASNKEQISKPSFSAPSCLKSSQSSAEEKPSAKKRKSSIGTTSQNKRMKLDDDDDDSLEKRVQKRRSSKFSAESTPTSGMSRRRSERLVLKSSNLSSSQSSNNSDDIFGFCSSHESDDATPEKKKKKMAGLRNHDVAIHQGKDAIKTSTELCSTSQEKIVSNKSNHRANLGTHTIKEEEAEIESTDSKSSCERNARVKNGHVDVNDANVKALLPQTTLPKSDDSGNSQTALLQSNSTGKSQATQLQSNSSSKSQATQLQSNSSSKSQATQLQSNSSGKSQATQLQSNNSGTSQATLPGSFGQGASNQQVQRKRKPEKKDVVRRTPGESPSPLKSKSILNYFSPFAGTVLSDEADPLLLDDRPPSQESSVLVSTNLHQWEKDIMRSAVKELRSFSLSEEVTSGCVVVTGSRRRTLKILNGIALGCWIVKFSWIQESRREGRWLDLNRYEAANYFPACQENRIERTERRGKENYSRNLFSCCGSIYLAPGCDPENEELERLIVTCRGRISSSLRKAQICIGKPLRRATINVSEKWVLDSITENRCLEFGPYLLK